jgi:hypothetical protein
MARWEVCPSAPNWEVLVAEPLFPAPRDPPLVDSLLESSEELFTRPSPPLKSLPRAKTVTRPLPRELDRSEFFFKPVSPPGTRRRSPAPDGGELARARSPSPVSLARIQTELVRAEKIGSDLESRINRLKKKTVLVL